MTKSRNKKGPSGPDKKFQNVIGMLHSGISQHRYGNIFHNPIKKSEAPDYHDIVKRPMDLKTIKARVKDGLIANSLEFQRDVYLMFANAMMYNRPGSEIYNMAEEVSVVHALRFLKAEYFACIKDDARKRESDQYLPSDRRISPRVVLMFFSMIMRSLQAVPICYQATIDLGALFSEQPF